MITDIIYKVYKLEKRIKQLEKNAPPAMREDYGLIVKGQGITVNNRVYSQRANQAMLILAPSDVLLTAFVRDKSYRAMGSLCILLARGENDIELTCAALEQDVKCVLITKIIDLG